MAMLTSAEKKQIADAVAEAEANTGAEIVTALIPESDDYAFRELLFGIGAGIMAFVILSLLITPFNELLDRMFWNESTAVLPLAMGIVSLVTGALFYFLFQIPFLDRLIIGKRTMAEAVKNRALRHFVESAAYDTVDRTGVLLFISVLERRVELIADKGINDLVQPDTWNRIVSTLVQGIGSKQTGTSILTAVSEIGEILAEFVPPRPDDINEIPDSPTELGKGS